MTMRFPFRATLLSHAILHPGPIQSRIVLYVLYAKASMARLIGLDSLSVSESSRSVTRSRLRLDGASSGGSEGFGVVQEAMSRVGM